MLDRLEFLLSEAFVSLRRNTWMTFAAVTTSAMALFIIGGISLGYIALFNLANSIEEKFDMKVLMKDNPTTQEISSLGEKLNALDGVKTVEFKNRIEVWDEFRAANPGIDDGIELDYPLPDTYTLTFDDLTQIDKITAEIQKMPEVSTKDGVNFLNEEQNFLSQTMSAMRWSGLVLGGIMLLTGGILIFNTVRLTMNSRRKEIRIMELTGATKSMINTPMLIEGGIHGLSGAIVATSALWISYRFATGIVSYLNQFQNPEPFPLGPVILTLGLIGVAFGVACSMIAVREPKQKEIPR